MKLRGTVKHFMERKESGSILIKPSFCIEVLQNRKWGLLGNSNGLYKFETAKERDEKLAELKVALANKRM